MDLFRLLRPADPHPHGSAHPPAPCFPQRWRGTRIAVAVGLVGLLLWAAAAPTSADAQEATSDTDRPTIENPVRIQVEPVKEVVRAGTQSALRVTFRLPKFMWLGPEPDQARTPAGTKIQMEGPDAFAFGDARFPEPQVEGLPVHLGLTRAHEGEIRVIVPFEVRDDARPGRYDLTARITYTPGFNAGNLTTHTKEPYSTTVRVESDGADDATPLPSPSVAEVPNDFQVRADRNALISTMEPVFHRYEEGSAFKNLMHTLFNDPPGHNKVLRHAPFPFFESTNQSGTSVGGGVTFLNSTQEGVMTGSLSLQGFYNEYVGGGLGFDYLTCPAAYKNLQISGRAAPDEYAELEVSWEDFTFGSNDRWGVQLDGTAVTDPRTRFYGVGRGADDEDVSIYDHEEVGGTLDLYHLPVEKFRIGIGAKARYVDVAQGLTDVTDSEVNGFLPQFTEVSDFQNVPGLDGATVAGGRFNMIYDARNQEFNPTSGFFGTFTAEIDQVVDDQNDGSLDDTYGRFNLTLRQYISTVNRKWTLVLRNKYTVTTSEDIPFFEKASLGGLRSLRAFDENRFYGQHAAFGSVELRHTVGNVTFMGFPFAVKMNAFVDGGQVFDSTDQLFDGEFNVNPGLSLRLSNPPNVGFTSNISFGQDGVNFSGGVSLPI